MINEQYIILLVRLDGITLATKESFNHKYQAKEWITENGKKDRSYIILKEYSKK